MLLGKQRKFKASLDCLKEQEKPGLYKHVNIPSLFKFSFQNFTWGWIHCSVVDYLPRMLEALVSIPIIILKGSCAINWKATT